MDNIAGIADQVNRLKTVRGSIKTAIEGKMNGTSLPSGVKFADFPSYITSAGIIQYQLGYADGESAGGGGGVNANNSQLANSYIGTGDAGSDYLGTYTKLANTYHRGFNVYKNANYNTYLIAIDDSGNRWAVFSNPSEGATRYWYEGTSTSFGPVGMYILDSGSGMSLTIGTVNPDPTSSDGSSDNIGSSDTGSSDTGSSDNIGSSDTGSSDTGGGGSSGGDSSDGGGGSGGAWGVFGNEITSGTMTFGKNYSIVEFYEEGGIYVSGRFTNTTINGYSTYNGQPIFVNNGHYLVNNSTSSYNLWTLFTDSSLTMSVAVKDQSRGETGTPVGYYYGVYPNFDGFYMELDLAWEPTYC